MWYHTDIFFLQYIWCVRDLLCNIVSKCYFLQYFNLLFSLCISKFRLLKLLNHNLIIHQIAVYKLLFATLRRWLSICIYLLYIVAFKCNQSTCYDGDSYRWHKLYETSIMATLMQFSYHFLCSVYVILVLYRGIPRYCISLS